MADHNLPTLTSTYSDFVAQLDARLDDITKGLDVSASNLPDGAIKWSGLTSNWQKWNLSTNSWAALSAAYSININGTVGATSPASGAFTTLSASTSATLPANTTLGGATAVSISSTQTLTNKTLTAPVISTISNSGTITLPTGNVTLVARDTTDTLSNKTLTAPKFVDLGYIADIDGNELIVFDSIANAVNYIKVTNSISTEPVTLEANGDATNVDINVKSKGAGAVRANGVIIADLSGTQTLTNKTLGTGSIWNGNTVGVSYGGTGSSTALNAGGIAYGSTASAYATTVAGTAGQLLKSGGTGAPSWVSASSLSVDYANTAGRAAPKRADGVAMDYYYTATAGQPTYLWGTTDGTNIYAYNPSNFSVNYATTSGSAGLASSVTVNYNNNSDSNYQMLWGSGDAVYGTAGIYCNPATDSLYVDGNITAYTSSDINLKENVTEITGALDIVAEIGGKYYDWTEDYIRKNGGIDNYHLRKQDFGVIAQDVLKALPVAVRTRKDGTLAVDYPKMVAVAFAAINELKAEVRSLRAQLPK
jgi:hypothetical protein